MATESQPCSYCGLPTTAHTSPGTPVFCCLGCRIASELIQDDEEGRNRWALTKLGLAIFFSMNVMVFTLVLWTWHVHELPDNSQVHTFREVLRYTCLLLSAPVLILLGGPLVESSVAGWKQRRFTTDMLLLAGVLAAFGYSVGALVLGLPDVYFEVACMILVAVTLGKWFEATAKHKASQALRSLRKLLPDTVRRMVDGKEQAVALDEIVASDLIRVLAGERVPIDGEIEAGAASMDEQVITGEALPRVKHVGEPVHGGTLNLDGDLLVRATTTARQGVIARLVRAVEEAAASECRSVRLADRVAAWFVPIIAIAAAIAFTAHFPRGTQYALMSSLSVILIACPCALGIATPLALWVAINIAAKHGVLFRDGDSISRLAGVCSLGLDKTGTLTRGDVCVVKECYADHGCTEQVREITVNLASSSNHVLSKAIANHLNARIGITVGAGNETFDISDIRDQPGRGITATVRFNGWAANDSSLAILGSCEFARAAGLTIPSELDGELRLCGQHAVVCVGWNGKVRAAYLLSEQLRPEAKQVLDRLAELGLQLMILTGDHHQRAAAIEQATGVSTVGQLLPEDKDRELRKLPSPVAMVGDGINDAPALARADVGIAMDCGADVSRDAADVCLMGSTLGNLPGAISLARATHKTIKRNLVWALAYNVVGIGFALTGNLNPIIAAIAMVGSSLFVVTNSFSLSNTDYH